MNKFKFKHFYINKYFVSRVSKHKYYLSYNYKYKTLWFRTYKVASSTIRIHFLKNTPEGMNVYSSEVGYIPSMFKDFTKFAFVREPADKLLSAYKDKVLKQNYFNFCSQEYAKMQNISYFLDWLEDQDIGNCERHLRSQNSMIDLNNIDFLGRFESFDEDYRKFCDLIGMPVHNIEIRNKSRKEDLVLTSAHLQKIHKIYEKDYAIFYPQI